MTSLLRYGILTDEIDEDMAKALPLVKKLGLGYVGLRRLWGENVVDLLPEQEGALRALLAQYALSVSHVASPVFKCALDPKRPPQTSGDRFGSVEAPLSAHFEWLKRCLALAKRFNASGVRIFSFWREDDPTRHFEAIVEHLQEAGRIAQDYGIFLLLENEPSCNAGSIEEVAELVSAVNLASVGVLWDPGNDCYAGLPVRPQQAGHLVGRCAHVHLKDVRTDPEGRRTIVPLGQGEVPWAAILQALKSSGYQGHFSLEPHLSQGIEGVEESVGGLQTLLSGGK